MGKKSRNKEQRRIVDSRAHSSRESSEIASRTSSIYSPPVPRQPYLPAPCLKSNVTELRSHQVSWQIHHENGVAGHRRRQGLLQYPGGHDLSVRRSVAPRLIDTGCGSHSCHYVNRSVRGSRPPAKWRISLARFDLPRLRMRRISHPQVVASPIRPTTFATHYVATMPYRPFSPSARLLIPDWAQPKRLLPTPFPQLSPTPIHSGGRGQL